jgi:hypothetical protein
MYRSAASALGFAQVLQIAQLSTLRMLAVWLAAVDALA